MHPRAWTYFALDRGRIETGTSPEQAHVQAWRVTLTMGCDSENTRARNPLSPDACSRDARPRDARPRKAQ